MGTLWARHGILDLVLSSVLCSRANVVKTLQADASDIIEAVMALPGCAASRAQPAAQAPRP